MERASVVVVGAGLAGVAAAYRLAESGHRVVVLESGAVPGGRTASWDDQGMAVESGLHKFLGIYRNLPALLRDVGVEPNSILTWVDALQIHVPEFRLPGRLFADSTESNPADQLLRRAELGVAGTEAHASFGAAPYHRPLKTLLGLLGNNRLIPPLTKLRLTRMALNGLADCARRPGELDRQNMRDYGRRYGLSERAVFELLHTLTAGVLFMPPEEFSAYAAFAPALEGLKRGMTFRVGAFRGGMTEVMIRPVVRGVEARGGAVRTNAPVSRLLVESGEVVGVAVGEEIIRADHVVLAAPLAAAQGLIRGALPDHPWFRPMLSLRTLSAVTIQLELDRPALASDHTNFSPTGVCCFAEQSRTTFTHVPGRLSVILYPPERFLHMEPGAILERTIADAARIGIDLRGRVRDYRVVRHPHDFYALRPGSEALRPAQATPVGGLSLAGDYTKQPFVASMEGAVISGELAARASRAELESRARSRAAGRV